MNKISDFTFSQVTEEEIWNNACKNGYKRYSIALTHLEDPWTNDSIHKHLATTSWFSFDKCHKLSRKLIKYLIKKKIGKWSYPKHRYYVVYGRDIVPEYIDNYYLRYEYIKGIEDVLTNYGILFK